MGFGGQNWGTSGFGTQGTGTGASDFSLALVEPIAKDLIRIYFSTALVVDEAFTDVDNYVLLHESDSSPLLVKEVLPPKDGSVVTDYALLHTVRLVEGVTYTASVVNLTSRAGGAPSSSTVTWEYKRTKADSILNSLPDAYNKHPHSNIRGFLTAMSLSDNRIGGNPVEDIE